MVCLYFEHIVQCQVTCVFLVSILNNKPCHIPLKYRCSIKSSGQRRPTYLRSCGGLPQVIDVRKGILNNVITFPPTGSFVVDSTIQVVSKQRVDFRYYMNTPGLLCSIQVSLREDQCFKWRRWMCKQMQNRWFPEDVSSYAKNIFTFGMRMKSTAIIYEQFCRESRSSK